MTRRGLATSTVAGVLVVVTTIWWTRRPSPSVCREGPNRFLCDRNLKLIGQAVLLYGNENHDAIADSFATLLRTQDLSPEVFVDPSDAVATPAKDAAAFEAGPAHCSYIYLGDRMPMTTVTVPSDAIIALDREANHDGDGVNLLCGDGHVEFMSIGRRDKPAPWWLDVQSQIARGVRPVMLPDATTQPAR